MVLLIYFLLNYYSILFFFFIRSKVLVFLFFIIPISLFAAFRGANVDRDYKNYYYLWYIEIKEFSYYLIEGSSKLIFTLSKSLGIEFYYALLIFSFSSLTVKYLAIEKLNLKLYIAFPLYFSIYFFIHEMTQVRLSLAISITILAFAFYIKDQKKTCYALMFLAISFHISTIVFILFIFLNDRRNSLIYLLLSVLLFTCLAYLSFDVTKIIHYVVTTIPLFSKYVRYFQDGWFEKTINIVSFTHLSFYFFACCSTYYIYYTKSNDKTLILSTKLVLIGLLLIPLLSSLPAAAFRLSRMYLFFMPIMISSLFHNLRSGHIKILVISLVALYTSFICYVTLIRSEVLLEYVTIFE